MQRRILKSVLAAAGAFGAVLLTPLSTQAAPHQGGNYGIHAYEGSYPTVAGCTGTFAQKHTRSAEGMTLRYYYSSKCGSFSRIENARPGCVAVTERSGGWVSESVDPGVDYAYTKMVNNLAGRTSRGILSCDGHDLASTPWH